VCIASPHLVDLAAPAASTLDATLACALRHGGSSLDRLTTRQPADRADAVMALLRIHDLHTAPLARLDGTARWQHHPAVAALKWRLEESLMAQLSWADHSRRWSLPQDPTAAMRAIAALDRMPPVYQWLADEASREEVVEFLALEGGPDGGFDDLVAICQVGLEGGPKLELARNYWDEMGRGDLDAVHTNLHRRLVEALELPAVPRAEQPLEALERAALGSLLATNRWLQPEMLGALGLIELQAGPRCRKVVAALTRLGLPGDALPFYYEHATADPRHGREWLDQVVTPLARDDPEFGQRMVRGARWRSTANARFLTAISARLDLPLAEAARANSTGLAS
jgi:hypothetical protein